MYRDVWKKIMAVVVTICLLAVMVYIPSGPLKAKDARTYHTYQYGESEFAGIVDAKTAAAVFMTGQNESGAAEILESISFDVYAEKGADSDASALVELYTDPEPGDPASGTYAAFGEINGLAEGTNRISLADFSVKLMKGECFTIVVTIEGEGFSFYTDEFEGSQRTFLKAADGIWEDLGEKQQCAVIRAVTADEKVSKGLFGKMSAAAESDVASVEIGRPADSIHMEAGTTTDELTDGEGRDNTTDPGTGNERSLDDGIAPVADLIHIVDAEITLSEGTNYAYTGAAVRPAIVVMYDGQTLREGADYSAAYSNNIEVGTGVIEVTGIGNFTGTVTLNFEILPASVSINEVAVSAIPDQPFTGKPVYPTITATYRNANNVDVPLIQDVDYTLTYRGNTSAGTAVATVRGMGQFAGSRDVNFRIVEHSIDAADVSITDIPVQAYSGNPLMPEFTLTYGDYTLQSDDYTAVYSDNIEIGTATVRIDGQNNFLGTRIVYFQIVSNSMLDAQVTGLQESYPYTGEVIRPNDFTVSIGGNPLTVGEDYTVSYEDNIEVGTATVSIQGMGFYRNDIKKVTFRIDKKDISDDDIEMEGFVDSFLFNDQAVEQNITLRHGSRTLREDTDYTIQYLKNNAIGTASMTITGIGNYTGTILKEYAIYKVSAIDSEVVIENMSSVYVYTGEPIIPEPRLSRNGLDLTAGEDYDLEFENNVDSGIATMRIVGRNNCPGVREVTFNIIRRSIHLAAVDNIGTQTYTGVDIEPTVTVSENGTALVADRDYVLSYRLNREPGTAVAVIMGIGNYTATKEVRFDIRPGTVPSVAVTAAVNSSASISWVSGGASTGYEIFRADADGQYQRVARKNGTTYTDPNLTAGMVYYYKVRAYYVTESDTYYGNFSPSVRAVVR